MARQVKCKICGKLLDKENAYCIEKIGKKTTTRLYYCSEKEYKDNLYDKSKKEQLKKDLNDMVASFIGETHSTVLYKEMQLWGGDTEKIISYLRDNKYNIGRALAKDFVSEYAKIRYFSAIIKNNINDFKPKAPEIIKKSDDEFYEAKFVQRKRRKCLSDYKDGDDE